MKHSIWIIIGLFFWGCSPQQESSKQGKFTIVVTTGMIEDVIKEVVQDRAEVIALMGPGVDPHQYTAVQSDLGKLNNADLIIYNGLHLEGKMQDVFEQFEKKGKAISMADGLSWDQYRKAEDSDAHDPHIWMNVAYWNQALSFATSQIMRRDSANLHFYEENLIKHTQKLETLHEQVKGALGTIPKEQRVLVTAHDAFGYFGEAYEVDVEGLQGISTVSEAGLKRAQELANLIIDRNIKAIFVESSVPQKRMERLVESCRDSGHEVKIGGELYSDAMGPKGTTEGTYEGMIRSNVETIVTALK